MDEDCNPIEVAGCPPDAFSDEGQLWGNPLYNWDYMKKTVTPGGKIELNTFAICVMLSELTTSEALNHIIVFPLIQKQQKSVNGEKDPVLNF